MKTILVVLGVLAAIGVGLYLRAAGAILWGNWRDNRAIKRENERLRKRDESHLK